VARIAVSSIRLGARDRKNCNVSADSAKFGAFRPGEPFALIRRMDDEEFDQLMARARDPRLFPGIYNSCDRRCERCRFTDRCFHHLESRRRPRPDLSGEGLADAVGNSFERAFELIRIMAERQGIDLSSTPEELAAYERDEEIKDRRAEADHLVILSKQYLMTTWPITRALWPVIMPREDTEVMEALETIETLCTSISAKVYRAVVGSLEEDFDAAELQSDVNGSVKIARLMVDESRRAWRVMMEVGRATANGVPARLVKMLDELDSALGVRFPRAMDFMRPGFDTERAAACTEDGRDPALAGEPQGHA
jgi:hypothetical protein